MRRRGAALAVAAITGLTTIMAGGVASAAPPVGQPATAAVRTASYTETRGGVSAVPISFKVRNVNRSLVACKSDGRTYTVRGHLVAPSGQVGRAHADAASLYLHGLSFGEFFWRFRDVRRYDFAAQEARRGHVSVVVDRLGYGRSDKPHGFDICVGSRADIAHQMVQQLKSGHYRLAGHRTTRFDKVALVGHSYGGQIAQVAAYSFGDIDAVGVIGYSDRIQSQVLLANAAYAAAVCATGGQRVDGTGPGGYAPFGPPSGAPAALFNSATPSVEAAALKRLSIDPCGDTASFAAATAVDLQQVGSIRVPVLVVAGGADALFPRPAGPDQAALLTGSSEVTQVTLPGTAHAITLEATHRRFVEVVDRWLDRTVERWG